MKIADNIFSKRKLRRTRRLIERYFDAQTTVSEEQRLFKMFASGRYPAELASYAEMFADCAALAGITADKPAAQPALHRTLHRAGAFVAAAAAAVALAMVVHSVWSKARFERLYGGSYVIVNGKRMTDPDKISHTIEKTLAEAENIERNMQNDKIINSVEDELLENIADPAQRAKIEQLLSN